MFAVEFVNERVASLATAHYDEGRGQEFDKSVPGKVPPWPIVNRRWKQQPTGHVFLGFTSTGASATDNKKLGGSRAGAGVKRSIAGGHIAAMSNPLGPRQRIADRLVFAPSLFPKTITLLSNPKSLRLLFVPGKSFLDTRGYILYWLSDTHIPSPSDICFFNSFF